MKVQSTEQYSFQPIEVKLTFESNQDLRAFFELGNTDAQHLIEILNQSDELTVESIRNSFEPLYDELKKYYGLR